MTQRDHITLLSSFYATAKKFPTMEEVGIYFMAICEYGFEGQRPEDLPYAVDIAFGLIKPILDSSKRKAEAGSKGGSSKNQSKPETTSGTAPKQLPSKDESPFLEVPIKDKASPKHMMSMQEATMKQSGSKTKAGYEQHSSTAQAIVKLGSSELRGSLQKDASEYEYDSERDYDYEDERESPPPYSPPKGQITRTLIRYLNDKVGTRFSPASKHTLENIERLLGQGFTQEDFLVVIDYRHLLWQKGKCPKEKLRPEFLFGGEFPQYLNDAKSAAGKEMDYRDYD